MDSVLMMGKDIYKANKNRVSLSFVYDTSQVSKSSNKEEFGGAEWHFMVKRTNNQDSVVEGPVVTVFCNRKSADVSCDAVCTIRLLSTVNDMNVKINHRFTGAQIESSFSSYNFPCWADIRKSVHGYSTNGKSLTICVDIVLKQEFTAPDAKYMQLFSSSSAFESDCRMLLEGKHVHVLKSYLSMHSGFFRAMFGSGFSEKDKDEIELKDISYNEFIELLAVIYPSNQSITERNIKPVLKLADRFEMLGVIKSCEEFLLENTGTVIGEKLFLAQTYRLQDLLKELAKNYRTWADLEKLKKDPVYEMLEHPTLGALCENVISLC